MSGSDFLNKLPKLRVATDYIQWRRRMLAFLRRDDPFLDGLTAQPEAASATARQMRFWQEKSIKAKSCITLSLGDSALALTRTFIDENEKSTKELWDELKRIYTTSNAQAVQNIRQRLDTTFYKDGTDWNKHVATFLEIIGELAMFDMELPESEKTSKLIRSLPDTLAPLSMVLNIQGFSFDQIVSSVQAEISRRANSNNRAPTPSNTQPIANAASQETKCKRYRNKRGRSDGASGGIQKNQCRYCKKKGHWERDCWQKQRDLEGNKRPNSSQGNDRSNRRPSEHIQNGANGGRHSRSDPDQTRTCSWNDENRTGSNEASVAPSANQAKRTDEPPPSWQYRRFIAQHHDNLVDEEEIDEYQFRTKIAGLTSQKKKEAYIDSGATHHFFHSRKSFIRYDRISEEIVKAASSTTRLVGKGHVWIPLNKGMVVEAYHAPAFDSNIISVGVLSDQFMVTFTSSLRPFNGCFIMDLASRDIVWETPLCNGLYAMNIGKGADTSTDMKSLLIDASQNKFDVAMKWHQRTGHMASSRSRSSTSQYWTNLFVFLVLLAI